MRVPIRLPEVGEPNARFSVWFVQVGERVREGERIAEVLIPGVAIDVLAPCDGVLVQINVRSRMLLEVGTSLGKSPRNLSPDNSCKTVPMRRTPGLFVVFEGIDGAGKTTQVDLLEQFIRNSGVKVSRSKEPTDGPWGQKIRQSATHGRLTLSEELDAFIQDRREHCRQLIEPALIAGEIVILDRYFYSTIAYQGSRADVQQVRDAMMQEFPIPDVVFLIDIAPEIGLSRISHGRGETPNHFEKKGSLSDARRVFLDLAAEHTNICLLDGQQGIDRVRQQVNERLLLTLLQKQFVQS